MSYEELNFLFDILLKGEKEMAFCHDSQLVLEVLLLRLCAAPRLESLIPLKPQIKEEKKEAPSSKLKTKDSLTSEKNPPARPLAPPSPSQNQNQSPALSQKSALPAKAPAKTPKGEDFTERFDFLEFLRKKDPNLTALVENLSLKKKTDRHFCFSAPKKFSYLKKKMADPALHNFLEKQLTEFLKSKEKVKIEFLDGLSDELNLREEKKQIEEGQLMGQAQKNPFVQEVKDLFQGEIKSVTKIPK